jgi:glycerol uptake facilitator-like aquaporin
MFGKVSMAHFNPAVTVGYLITGHIRRIQLVYYFAAEIVGALLASLFVKYFIGNEAHLGANSFNHSYPIIDVLNYHRHHLYIIMSKAHYEHAPRYYTHLKGE